MKKKALILTFSIILLVASLVVGLCSCNDKGKSDQDVTICQHEWVEVVQDSSLKTTATCESQAVYYKSCSKCGINGTDTFKAGEFKSHTYAEGSDVCSVCKKIKDESYAQAAVTKGYIYSETNNILYFGLYPQSIVLDAATLSSLNTSAGLLPTYTDFKNWKSFGYTEKGKEAEYMWYQDITVGDSTYRGVYFISYRPEKPTSDNSEAYSNQDNNGYYTSKVYWFKFEPIKWNIISKDGEIATIVSELALDAQYFNIDTSSIVSSEEVIYASNYENSTIRRWLNDTFYNTAFSALQKSLIINQVVDNKTTSDSIDNQHAVNQKNTNDNITLLSYKDLANNSSLKKVKTVTAYAQSLGAYSTTSSIAKWWTRSASRNDGYSIYFVSYDGTLATNEVNSTQMSIVPTINVRICTSDNPSGHEYAEVIAPAHLKSAATCISPAIYYKSCTYCGAHSSETFEVGTALGHTPTEVQDVKYLKSAATCTTSAIYYKSCSVCGEKLEETFEIGLALGHDYSKEYDVDPTCEEKGYRAHECTRCGDVQKDNEKAALGHIMDEIVDPAHLKSAASCDSPAIYYKSCTRKGCNCQSENETFEYGLKLGHNFVDVVDNLYLKASATCTSRAIYYKSCTRCSCTSEETFGFGSPLGHVYDKDKVDPTCCEAGYSTYTCQRCSHSYVSDNVYALGHEYDENNKCIRCDKVNVTDTYYIDYSEGTIYFGSYPQNLVSSSTLAAALNELAGVVPTQIDPGKWKAYSNYYLNGELAIYSWYIDVELEIKTSSTTSFKEKYRGLYFINYRDNNVTGDKTLGERSNQEINGYNVKTVYWFRYDPIKWWALTVGDGKVQMVTDYLLDSQQYNSWTTKKKIEGSTFQESYPNDWETSDLRKWLNSTFYNTAFTSDEMSIINDAETANYRTYANSNYVTTEKLFIPSMDVLKNFKSEQSLTTDAIRMYGTDYARSQGIEIVEIDGEETSPYWARDPKTGNNYTDVNIVDSDGSSQYGKVTNSCLGVFVIVVISLKECQEGKHNYKNEIEDADCTHEGYEKKVCQYCGRTIVVKVIPKTGHNYHDGICTVCDAVDYSEVNAIFETKGYALNNNILFFGKYPQTEIPETNSIYADLCNQVGTTPTQEDFGKWISYGYYYYDTKTKDIDNKAFVWYYDTQYGGEWYRGVYFTNYRPNSTSDELDSSYNYVKENGFLVNHIYWFKYEPIQWLVLETAAGYVTATTELQIDAQYFNQSKESTIQNKYATDWENSFVRSWLNGTFYNTAFSEAQKAIIQENYLNNRSGEILTDGGNSKYYTSQNNTIDKIYLPSLYDWTTSYDQFEVDYRVEDYWRQNESSDYARIQGTYVYSGGDYDLNGYVLLRSPYCSDGNTILITDYTGSIDTSKVDTVNGIVPMIKIKITDCQCEDCLHQYSADGICNFCGAIKESDFTNAMDTKGYAVSNTFIYFGYYPQSIVYDSATLTSLDSIVFNESTWTSYKYSYNGSTDTDYMYYYDVTIGGTKYRGVYFKQYRQLDANAQLYSSLTNSYEANKVYWFKFEPIKWVINRIEKGTAYISSSIVLDSQFFDSSTTNYQNSYIKSWLNGSSFYNLAFSDTDKLKLVGAENSRVSLPVSSDDSLYPVRTSDYAIIQGLETINGYYNNNWLTQSVNSNNQLYYYKYTEIEGRRKSTEGTSILTAGANISYTSYGIIPTIAFRYCDIVGHDYNEIVLSDNSNRKSKADCTTPAIYKKVCRNCGDVSETELFQKGEALGHDYKLSCNGHATCSRCSDEVDYYVRNGDTITFGSYPQTLVTDATLISALNSGVNTQFKSYGYYSGNTINNFMQYRDYQYDGKKYRQVLLKEFRPTSNSGSNTASDSNQDEYGYSAGTEQTYWFEYTPITWNIVESFGDQVILAANLMLDSQPYLNVATLDSGTYYNKNSGVPSGTYANDYSYSAIRQWLNDTFYSTAFSTLQKSIINITRVDSNGYSNYDNVWIACSNDSYYEKVKSIKHLSSDYAKMQGVSTYFMNRQYASTTNGNIVGIDNSGSSILNSDKNVLSTELGIIPIIKINICNGHSYKDTVIKPTCTEQGYTIHECTICHHQYIDTYVDALGHTGGTATCTEQATCSRCQQKYGDSLGHNYVDGICDRCGNIDMSKVEESMAAKGYALCKDTLFFGYYPQTLFTDTTIISVLDTKLDKSDMSKWNKYDYYSNGTSSNIMYYYDVEYSENNVTYKYRAIFIKSFRPNSTDKETTTIDNEGTVNNSYQDENGYTTQTIYWFKYEPIKWRVLSSKNSNLVVISTLALDAQAYQNCVKQGTENEFYIFDGTDFIINAGSKVYGTNWELSTIREWLNNDFYKAAFSETQKNIIQTTTLVNSSTANQGSISIYSCFQNDTKDNVYLASYSDLINALYGFANAAISDANKQIKATDYAKAQGIYVDGTTQNVNWWSRSANQSSLDSAIVSRTGSFLGGSGVMNSSAGIVPMLSLNLCAGNHEYVEKITENNLKSDATCTSKAVYYKVCLHCGDQATTDTFESGEKLPHKFEVIDSKDATCEADGYVDRKCSVCGETEHEILHALGHIGGTATCSEQATCSRCGEKYGDLLEHTLVYKGSVDAGCEDGYTIYDCSKCGAIIKTNIIAGTGHTGGTSTCQHKKICDNCYQEYGELAPHDFSIVIDVPKTCTSYGYKYHKCKVCGMIETDASGKIKEYDVDNTNIEHEWIEKLTAPYLKSRATCTACAVFYYACAKCGAKSEDIYECSDPTYTSFYALGHKYVDGICTECGDKMIKRVNENNKEDLTGKYILFGSYPQTLITDDSILQGLQKKAKFAKTVEATVASWATNTYYYQRDISSLIQPCSDGKEWKSGDTKHQGLYYYDFSSSTYKQVGNTAYNLNTQYYEKLDDNFKYIEIIYNGDKYRAVYFTSDKAGITESKNGYSNKTIYWFKYEKIKWKILKQDNGEAILQSTVALDGQIYDTEDCYWEYSYLRSWLNETFKNTAFVSSPYVENIGGYDVTKYPEQEAISNVENDNKTTSSGNITNTAAMTNGSTTTDNVYLLSYADYYISSYGKEFELGNAPTDYAKAQSMIMNKYWTKSNVASGRTIFFDVSKSPIETGEQVNNYVLGIIPMLTVQLCETHSYVNGRCSKCGNLLYEDGKDAEGKYLIFGSYPQTKLTDTTLNSILNNLYPVPVFDPSTDLHGWTYAGKDNSSHVLYDGEDNNFYYIDVNYLGERYRGIYYSKYKKTKLSDTSYDADHSYQDDNGYAINTAYWFKYEDIKWRILTSDEGETMVYADLVLDSRSYSGSSSNWEHSALNSWLNNDFIDTAFTYHEKGFLSLMFVDNKTTSNAACIKTETNINEYVTLLSYADLTSSSYRDLIKLKKKQHSEYAAASGYNVNGDVSSWLRSTSADGKTYAYNYSSESIAAQNTDNSSFGVIPVICLQTCSHAYEYTSGSLICKYCRHIAYKQSTYSYNDNTYPVVSIGSYPTEQVTDDTVIAKLNAMVTSPVDNANGWIVGRKFNNEAHIWYTDIELAGIKYRGVFFDKYMPYSMDTSNIMDRDHSYQDDNGYYINTIYWFKYTAINWKLAYLDNDYYVLICDIALDVMYFDTAPADWGSSELCEWMQCTMYNDLFTTAEQNILQGLTYQKLSIINQDELSKVVSLSKQMKATDYSQCQGAQMDGEYTLWVTSTSDTQSVQFVDATGALYGQLLNYNYSIVPMIILKANKV